MINKKFIGFTLNFFAMLFIFTIAGCVNQQKSPFFSKTAQTFLNDGEYESSLINIKKLSGTSVKDFGAVGDGIHDDTDAIQKCIMTTEKNSKKFHYDSAYPEVVFPQGTYLISRPIVISLTNRERGLSIKGLGEVTIKQKNPDCDVFYIHNGYRHVIDNISFDGGKRQIKFYTRNKDASHLLVRNCKFSNSSSYAIDDALKGIHYSKIIPPYKIVMKNDLPELIPNNVDVLSDVYFTSTLLTVEKCEFRRCANVLRVFSDWGIMRDCSIETSPEMKGAAIYSRGALKLENVQGLAHVKPGNHQRWIDNIMTGVMLQNVTFDASGDIGMCPVFNRRIYDNGGLRNVYVIIDSCQFKVAGSPENSVVYCEEVPNLIAIRNTVETSGTTIPAIGFRPKVTKEYLQFVSFPELVKRLPELPRIYGYMVRMPRIYSDVVGYKYKNNFSISLDRNTNLSVNLPKVLQQFVEKPLPLSIQKGFKEPKSKLNVTTMDAMIKNRINISDFGVYPNGKDVTATIQKIFDSLKGKPMTEIVFPNGIYRVSNTIFLPKSIAIRGLGMACFKGDGKIKRLFVGKNSKNLLLRNLGFFKVDDAIVVKTSNNSHSKVRVEMCLFTQLSGTGVSCFSKKEDTTVKNKTAMLVSDCVFRNTLQAIRSNANDARFERNWISSASNVKGYRPTFVNYGHMAFRDIIAVPRATAGCWIENHKSLKLDNFRFGGEGRWKNNIINNKSSNGGIFIENSWLNCDKENVVNCLKLPAILALRCNMGIPAKGFQKMVKLPLGANITDLNKVFYETTNIPPTIIIKR